MNLKWYIVLFLLCVIIIGSGCTQQKEPPATTPVNPETTNPVHTIATPETRIPGIITTQGSQATPSGDYLNVSKFYTPSGYMGDVAAVNMIPFSKFQPYSPPDCIKCTYNPILSSKEGWAGVYWLNPYDNWGDKEKGRDLSTYKKITFLTRGEIGNEKVIFCVGGINGTKYQDSISQPLCSKELNLTSDWVQYEIDLSHQNLSSIIGAFSWITSKQSNPKGCSFYIDDIMYK